jgi:hypothetical protein
MPIYVNDSGTWREIDIPSVNDAGTWRNLREVYVNDSGTWRRVYVNTVTFSLAANTGDDGSLFEWVGYVRSVPTGSVTPTGVAALPGSINFDALIDVYGFGTSVYSHSSIEMSGFSSDPGQTGFWVSVDIDSDDGPKNYTSASANGHGGAGIPAYSYSSGTATWTWSGGANEFDLNGIADPHDITFNF